MTVMSKPAFRRPSNADVSTTTTADDSSSNAAGYWKIAKVVGGTVAFAGVVGSVLALRGRGYQSDHGNINALMKTTGGNVRKSKAPKSKAPKRSRGPTGKTPKAKNGKTSDSDDGPTTVYVYEGKMILQNLDWAPANCGLTRSSDCPVVFCFGATVATQAKLDEIVATLDGVKEIKSAIECAPSETTRRLDEESTSKAGRALQSPNYSFNWIFDITIACDDSTCSNAAAKLAEIETALQTLVSNLTGDDIINGVLQVLDDIGAPVPGRTYYSNLSFTYAETSSVGSFSTPVETPVPTVVSGFKFLGPGYCGGGHGYVDYNVYVAAEDCLAACASSACLAQNGYTLLGVSFRAYDCVCHVFETANDPTRGCSDTRGGDWEPKSVDLPIVTYTDNSYYSCYVPN